MSKIELLSIETICKYVMNHIVNTLNLKDIEYSGCEIINTNNYSSKNKKIFEYLFSPKNGTYILNHNDKKIKIKIETFMINDKEQIINCTDKDYLVIKNVIIESDDIDVSYIKDFITFCNKYRKDFLDNLRQSSSGFITKKFLTKYGWGNYTHIHKRDISTIFLKKKQKEEIVEKILEFTNKESYEDYKKHGIPYKYNVLLHGDPGVGKTSLIHGLASECNAEICVININDEIKENEILEGLIALNDSKALSFVVIEDIDCIFKNRKEGDTLKNHITMQCLLNCLDGFSNQEGMILFLTTNYPEVLDSALTRSGRIDYNIELTHLDKQQASEMFESFFKDNNDIFEELWENVKKYSIPPSTFLDFLFSNRKTNDIIGKIPSLIKIINKKENINIYN